VLSGEATNTNFIVFGLTRPELEPTIYQTGGKQADHYYIDLFLSLDCPFVIIPDVYFLTNQVKQLASFALLVENRD
jgi:hypothetical protein